MTQETDAPQTGAARDTAPSGLVVGLVKSARPKQWIKNVLVFAAPAAAGISQLPDGAVQRVIVAFVVFCAAASGTYFLNDARDVDADRLHPKKRFRPMAAGTVPVWLGYVAGFVLLVASIVGAAVFANVGLAVVVAIYVALTTSYSLWLKHVAILDICLVAAGFIVRAVAGGVAAPVEISEWFLIVTSFGSLFMVSGKRYAEHLVLGEGAGSHRRALDEYTGTFLNNLVTVFMGVTVLAYCLWAFERGAAAENAAVWYQLSIAPFLVAILRYGMLLEAGKAGAPEEVVLGDRFLQVAGLVWVVVFGIGVYVR